MVTNVSNPDSYPLKEASNNSTHPSNARLEIVSSLASIHYEKVGPGGVQERLGAFSRLSAIPILLLLTLGLLSLSGYYLYKIERADIRWQEIVWHNKTFPYLVGSSSRPLPYFEGSGIYETSLGRMLKKRTVWVQDDVDFGLTRGTEVTYTVVVCLFATVGLLFFHLFVLCFLRRFRRKFQLITLGYGFVGLLVFTLCLRTLYFSFVHKISCYLENARIPPMPDESDPSPDNTVDAFINMTLFCTFIYSAPNPYAKDKFKFYPDKPEDSFLVNGSLYTEREMMQLGICPKQDDLVRALALLGVTTVLCWFVASYSQVVENRLLGPPVWLQRFKIKVHKDIRHWQTRTQVPSYIEERKRKAVRTGVDYIMCEEEYERDTANIDTPYSIMDGAIDHIMLADPLSAKPSAVRFLQSLTKIK